MDEVASRGEVFLSSRELVGCELDAPLWWWLSPIYSGHGPLPKCKAGRDATAAKFEGRQLVQVILTKGGLRLPKALVVTLPWAPR